ncbi:MAG: YheU family protein [Ferrimonas sp.]
MLIHYTTLTQAVSATAINNLLREYLFREVSDTGFDELSELQLQQAIVAAHKALQRGELVVEYSEIDESISVRRADELLRL